MQFERLESQLKGVTADAALCCLGTTLRKAGSRERFRAVDVDCVVTFARAARAANARRFIVISSVGANPGSRNFYLRTKGEMEQALEGIGFESLDILQPSALLGWRRNVRPLELAATGLMPLVNPLLVGRYLPYRGIAARTVGQAMLGATRIGRRGVQRYTYEGIQALARAATRAKAAPAPRADGVLGMARMTPISIPAESSMARVLTEAANETRVLAGVRTGRISATKSGT